MLGMIACKYVDEPYIAWNSLSGLHLYRRLCMPISIMLGVVSCKRWQKSRKKSEKDALCYVDCGHH